VLEELEEEPEMAPKPMLELVPEVMPKEVPTEGAMIVAHTSAPSPPHGASAMSSPAPHAAAAVSAAAGAAVGLEVILGHPTLYASDDIPMYEVVSMAHRALSQVQRVLPGG
jgi:hypothetical protein